METFPPYYYNSINDLGFILHFSLFFLLIIYTNTLNAISSCSMWRRAPRVFRSHWSSLEATPWTNTFGLRVNGNEWFAHEGFIRHMGIYDMPIMWKMCCWVWFVIVIGNHEMIREGRLVYFSGAFNMIPNAILDCCAEQFQWGLKWCPWLLLVLRSLAQFSCVSFPGTVHALRDIKDSRFWINSFKAYMRHSFSCNSLTLRVIRFLVIVWPFQLGAACHTWCQPPFP